jgi:endonuclease YncB( thermonuclease family)
MIRIICLLCLAFMSSAAPAQTVAGAAQIVDGDTLTIGGQRIRLFGVDAPESDQTCERRGESWACGETATEQLRSLTDGNSVSCEQQNIDQYGRIVAICRAGRYELGRTMVEYGYATAFRRYSEIYADDELRAKAAGRGLWSSTFELPEQHRQAQQAPTDAALGRQGGAQVPASASADNHNCMIKGNRNRRGEWIYHLPGSPYYEQTRAEDVFCTETQARAAGYRASRAR